MIDPDRQARETGAAALKRVIALAPKLGTHGRHALYRVQGQAKHVAKA